MSTTLQDLRERHGEIVERVLAAGRREGRLRDRPAWSVIWQQLMERAQRWGVEGRWRLAEDMARTATNIAFECADGPEANGCYTFAFDCWELASWRAFSSDRAARPTRANPPLYQGIADSGFVPWQGETPEPLRLSDDALRELQARITGERGLTPLEVATQIERRPPFDPPALREVRGRFRYNPETDQVERDEDR